MCRQNVLDRSYLKTRLKPSYVLIECTSTTNGSSSAKARDDGAELIIIELLQDEDDSVSHHDAVSLIID